MSTPSEHPARAFIVIVAEDEFLTRMVMAGALTDAGFEVIEAGNAAETLSILKSQAGNINALFTDIRMPGAMDGLGLAHYVRDQWPSVALLVTSDEMMPARGQLPAEGHFLPKPYHPREVVACIRELIAAKEALRQPMQ